MPAAEPAPPRQTTVNGLSALAVLVYLALMGSLATPLYDPLSSGDDDSWALAVLLAAAHLGLGLGVRRGWALLLPAAVGVGAFLVAGAEGLAWLILLFELPLLVLATALGWGLGRRLERHAAPAAAAALLVAALPGGWAALQSAQREPHVSAREQRALPTDGYTLVEDMCLRDNTGAARRHAAAARRRAFRQFDAIERSMRAHPDATVSVRFVLADAPGTQTREMSVRDLVETHLESAKRKARPKARACVRRGRARLQRMLDGAG